MNLSALSIRKQLLVMGMVSLLLLLFIGGLGLYESRAINEKFKSVMQDRVAPLEQLKVVADMYAVNIVDTTHKVRNGNIGWAQGLKNVEEAESMLHAKWQAYMATYMDGEEKTLAEQAAVSMRDADTASARLKEVLQAQDAEALAIFANQTLYQAIDPVSEKISALVSLQLLRADANFREAQSAYETSLKVTLGLIGAALALNLWIGRIISRGVTVPLQEALDTAHGIASGDLTRTIRVEGSNETAQLMKALASMQNSLRGLIGQIQQSVAEVSSSSLQLASSMEQVAQSSAHQAESTSAVAAAVEELTVSIEHVSDSAHQAEQRARDAGEKSGNGAEEVQAATTVLKRVEHSVDSTAQHMDELNLHAGKIGVIVNVIKDVADQTNLLALNAAIEAARAGEQGRGFAVVADEVRKLAERTGQSAQEITRVVETVQGYTQQAAAGMGQGSQDVKLGVTQAEQAGDSMKEINSSTAEVVDAVTEINFALNEQRAVSAQIASSIESIAQMTEENSAAVGEVAQAAARLEHLAEQLKAATQQFRLA